MNTRKKTAFIGMLVVGALAITGCSAGATTSNTGTGELAGLTGVIGSKEFTEQLILGNIATLALNNAGADVTYQELAGSANVRAALMSDDILGYYEYTGTGWLVYLENDAPVTGTKAQYDATAQADLAKNGIVWLDGAEFNNTYAFAIRSDKAKELGVSTMSEVAALPTADQTFCIEAEFSARPDGWPGFESTYGLKSSDISTLDAGPIYQITADGNTCNFGEVYTTDGRIAALDLTVMTDDKDFFPVYQGAFTLKESTLTAFPAIATVLNPLSAALTESVMQKLNAQVDIDGEDPQDVARQFLKDNGFLS
ncbi:MAG: glycine betaine ABC transporter substrate-binding protein [Actinomycetales bacterium]|nr:glycine betaine ABC transporter substrate-binding protein [Actinomycetales bacterium]